MTLPPSDLDSTDTDLFSDDEQIIYLGNHDLVLHLVSGFCSNVYELRRRMAEGDMQPQEVKAAMGNEIRRMADIFSGRNPEYATIKGYHEVSLGGKLIADLAPHWGAYREEWDDDAVAVLFDWLAAILLEKIKLADGDEMLLGVMFKPSMQYAVRVLLGVEARVGDGDD